MAANQAAGQPSLAVQDDATILDDDVVWRRLAIIYMPPDELNPGTRRLSKGGFDDSSDGTGMSVHLVKPDESPESYLASLGSPRDGIAALKVGDIRAAGFGIIRAPEPNDPRHCEVTPYTGKKPKAKALLRIATKVRDATKG